MSEQNLAATTQATANKLVDAAQELGNTAVDASEAVLSTVVGAALDANDAVGTLLRSVAERLVGK